MTVTNPANKAANMKPRAANRPAAAAVQRWTRRLMARVQSVLAAHPTMLAGTFYNHNFTFCFSFGRMNYFRLWV
jgi:hypothetical protein